MLTMAAVAVQRERGRCFSVSMFDEKRKKEKYLCVDAAPKKKKKKRQKTRARRLWVTFCV